MDMKTKFILHGGASSRKTPTNEKFLSKVVSSNDKNTLNILCVYFARPKHRWDESFYEDRCAFESVKTAKALNIEMATYENFTKQLPNSDVIFINGGFKGHLKETVEGIDEIREGAAILPIKIFCHFDTSLNVKVKELEKYKEDLPIYKIPEESFIMLRV